jgi:hypothetical protein
MLLVQGDQELGPTVEGGGQDGGLLTIDDPGGLLQAGT